jgi:hypothetical protein
MQMTKLMKLKLRMKMTRAWHLDVHHVCTGRF